MMEDEIVQVRMDPEDKRRAEELYRKLGTSFEEAVRIFARQSILENGMPFRPSVPEKKTVSDEGRTAAGSRVSGDDCSQDVVIRKKNSIPEVEELFTPSYGGFSAEMAIEKTLAKKHGEAEE